jgi:CRISPR type I-F-associated protein Csy1
VDRQFRQIEADVFGDAAKAARAADAKGEFCAHPVRRYADRVSVNHGGDNPINVGKLNSDRSGKVTLLASLPPLWRSDPTQLVFTSPSMFGVFQVRPEVRRGVARLRDLLAEGLEENKTARVKLARCVCDVVDEFLQFSSECWQRDLGWSRSPECALRDRHRRWLDPRAVDEEGSQAPWSLAEVALEISVEFATWLNERLRPGLAVGDNEHGIWQRAMATEIQKFASRRSV